MANKTQQRKAQKKSKRKKRLDKERNMRTNGARFRYALECRQSKDHPWRAMKRFRDAKEVQAHLEETEAIRKRGDSDIIEGRILDHNQLSRVVGHVKSFTKECGPSMLDAAKEVLNKTKSLKEEVGNSNLDAVSKYEKPKPQEEAEDAQLKSDDLQRIRAC